MQQVLVINPTDNVAVALADIPAGARLLVPEAAGIETAEPIPFTHKVALRRIVAGEAILKYGVAIGFATRDISPGAWVHEHNSKSYFAAKKETQGL